MQVVPIPCLDDNYAYLAFDPTSREACVVDPSEAAPILRAAEDLGLQLAAIFCTHHHPDHVDGIPALLDARPGIPVYAHRHDRDRTPGVTHPVDDGDTVAAAGLSLRALHVPGHTLGAVTWTVGDCAFTGDTLFLGGCGRVFEGTPEMMFHSLNEVLARLPADSRLFCGHEYTVSNLRFAAQVEPTNAALLRRLERARHRRASGQPTVPGTLAEELDTNPFLRCFHPDVVDYARRAGAPCLDPASVFASLRESKNRFKG